MGAAYGFLADQEFRSYVDLDVCTRGLWYALFCGVVGAVLFVSLARCALSALVFFACVAVGQQLASEFGTPTRSEVLLGVPLVPHWVCIVLGALAVTSLSRSHESATRVLVMASLGAWCVTAGVRSAVVASDGPPEWVFAVLFVVTFAFGAAAQRTLQARLRKRKRPPDAAPSSMVVNP